MESLARSSYKYSTLSRELLMMCLIWFQHEPGQINERSHEIITIYQNNGMDSF